MKKFIELFLVTLLVNMLLTGCSNNSEMVELRQEVENLQSELSQLKNQMCDTKSLAPDARVPESQTETYESETLEVKPNETTIKAVTNDMLDYLTMQLQSDYYADWNAVASCDYATEEHLLTAAKQCATISNSNSWAKTIEKSICENSAVTGKVLKELANSNYTDVTTIAHTKLEEL